MKPYPSLPHWPLPPRSQTSIHSEHTPAASFPLLLPTFRAQAPRPHLKHGNFYHTNLAMSSSSGRRDFLGLNLPPKRHRSHYNPCPSDGNHPARRSPSILLWGDPLAAPHLPPKLGSHQPSREEEAATGLAPTAAQHRGGGARGATPPPRGPDRLGSAPAPPLSAVSSRRPLAGARRQRREIRKGGGSGSRRRDVVGTGRGRRSWGARL